MKTPIAAIAGLLLSGCGYLGSARAFDPAQAEPGLILVKGLEPLRQAVENDCGPTALAMVLRYWGDPITQAEAVQALPPREGGGVTAGALRDHAKSRGCSAYVFAGTVEDLEHQLSKGRPLIVGLVKPYIDRIRPHFEVVAGWHPERKYVVTLDPARGWTRNSLEGFLLEWEPGGRPCLLVARAESPK